MWAQALFWTALNAHLDHCVTFHTFSIFNWSVSERRHDPCSPDLALIRSTWHLERPKRQPSAKWSPTNLVGLLCVYAMKKTFQRDPQLLPGALSHESLDFETPLAPPAHPDPNCALHLCRNVDHLIPERQSPSFDATEVCPVPAASVAKHLHPNAFPPYPPFRTSFSWCSTW